MRDHISPYSSPLRASQFGDSLDMASGIAALQNLVFAQAQTIAYLNTFIFLVAVSVVAMPLVFLLKPRQY